MPLSPDRPFFISPPFGSYLSHPRAYSVLGSFTRYPRPGRTGQVLRTIRPLGRSPDGEPLGWVNKIGLRNPGLCELVLKKKQIKATEILSIALVDGDEKEWEWFMAEAVLAVDRPLLCKVLEINVSCPNTNHPLPAPPINAKMLKFVIGTKGLDIVWKLSPSNSTVQIAEWLVDNGAKYLHLSNTLPSPIGGLSGAVLREVNLPLVERVAEMLERAGYKDFRCGYSAQGRRGHPSGWSGNSVEIIAGGGILTQEHLRRYQDAGATRFSMSTAWFWPPRVLRIMRSLK